MAQLNEFIDANLPQVRSLFERLSAAEAGDAAGAATAEAADDAGAAADDLVEIPQKIYQERCAAVPVQGCEGKGGGVGFAVFCALFGCA